MSFSAEIYITFYLSLATDLYPHNHCKNKTFLKWTWGWRIIATIQVWISTRKIQNVCYKLDSERNKRDHKFFGARPSLNQLQHSAWSLISLISWALKVENLIWVLLLKMMLISDSLLLCWPHVGIFVVIHCLWTWLCCCQSTTQPSKEQCWETLLQQHYWSCLSWSFLQLK